MCIRHTYESYSQPLYVEGSHQCRFDAVKFNDENDKTNRWPNPYYQHGAIADRRKQYSRHSARQEHAKGKHKQVRSNQSSGTIVQSRLETTCTTMSSEQKPNTFTTTYPRAMSWATSRWMPMATKMKETSNHGDTTTHTLINESLYNPVNEQMEKT